MTIRAFQKKILDWYEKNGRHDLPWRPPALQLKSDGSCDPYAILVSEVMLQQTQVDRVILKFAFFLKKFPSLKTLASADTRTLLAEWKGLGYNRRALYLQRAARMIGEEFGGAFPSDPADIERLPGVGHYTARAVAAFAFDAPEVFIETNIRRIFIHFFFPRLAHVTDAALFPLVERALWKRSPRVWYGALMDYGALAMDGIENPNKRSRHYVKQSRFEGSRRYARAKLLDFVMQKSTASDLCTIQKIFSADPHLLPYASEKQISSIIAALAKDGFLMPSGRGWKITSTPLP